jgi:hypothetical protein
MDQPKRMQASGKSGFTPVDFVIAKKSARILGMAPRLF